MKPLKIDIAERISSLRSAMMGVAIIMVVLYHATCCNLYLGPLHLPLTYGLTGVDIFLMLSAYGLCHSWGKNTKCVFYVRRYSRILPIYFILVAYNLIINELRGGLRS